MYSSRNEHLTVNSFTPPKPFRYLNICPTALGITPDELVVSDTAKTKRAKKAGKEKANKGKGKSKDKGGKNSGSKPKKEKKKGKG